MDFPCSICSLVLSLYQAYASPLSHILYQAIEKSLAFYWRANLYTNKLRFCSWAVNKIIGNNVNRISLCECGKISWNGKKMPAYAFVNGWYGLHFGAVPVIEANHHNPIANNFGNQPAKRARWKRRASERTTKWNRGRNIFKTQFKVKTTHKYTMRCMWSCCRTIDYIQYFRFSMPFDPFNANKWNCARKNRNSFYNISKIQWRGIPLKMCWDENA